MRPVSRFDVCLDYAWEAAAIAGGIALLALGMTGVCVVIFYLHLMSS